VSQSIVGYHPAFIRHLDDADYMNHWVKIGVDRRLNNG